MKPLPKLLLALTAVAALLVACPAKANLITNPGFEDGVTGWTFSNVAFVAIGQGTAHSGVANGTMFTGGANSPTISQSVATTAGATYTISFFAACSSVGAYNLAVSFGGTIFNHLFPSGVTDYTQFTFNATASGANTSLSFIGAGVGTLRLDDVSVELATVPDGGTTVSLFGCALVGLAGLRRKLGC